MSPPKPGRTTTPTSRCTYIYKGLIHHACVQPRARNQPDRCDLLMACKGYLRDFASACVYEPELPVTCFVCIATRWDIEVARMEREGLLSEIEDLELAHSFHRKLINSGALSEDAVEDTRW